MAERAQAAKKAPTLGELDDQKSKGKKGGGKDSAQGGKDSAAKNAKAEKEKTELYEKKSGKGKAVLVCCLFWLFLLGTAFIMVMFDPTEDRIIRGTVLLFLDPEGEAFEIYYQADLIDLQDRTRDLDYWEASLEQWESELDDLESEINDYAATVEEKEARADEILELYASSSGEQGQSVMERVILTAKTIVKMTAKNAASTLQSLYESDSLLAVQVSLEIGSSKLGPILDQMDAEIRAELVYGLLSEGVEDISDELSEYLE